MPSLSQRTDVALVVSVGNVAAEPLVNCAPPVTAGSNLVMRGPRPPDGLLTSDVWTKLREPVPRSQVIVRATLRKSSGCVSTGRLVALAATGAWGVQTSAGGVEDTLSFGSSNVQTCAAIV